MSIYDDIDMRFNLYMGIVFGAFVGVVIVTLTLKAMGVI